MAADEKPSGEGRDDGQRRFLRLRVIAPLLVVLFAILLLPGASLYYQYSGGRSCTHCHEIWQPYRDWHESAHRNIACSECHGDVMTLDAGFHLKNLRQLVKHLRGEVPEQVRLNVDDVSRSSSAARKCHREEYADLVSGAARGVLFKNFPEQRPQPAHAVDRRLPALSLDAFPGEQSGTWSRP